MKTRFIFELDCGCSQPPARCSNFQIHSWLLNRLSGMVWSLHSHHCGFVSRTKLVVQLAEDFFSIGQTRHRQASIPSPGETSKWLASDSSVAISWGLYFRHRTGPSRGHRAHSKSDTASMSWHQSRASTLIYIHHIALRPKVAQILLPFTNSASPTSMNKKTTLNMSCHPRLGDEPSALHFCFMLGNYPTRKVTYSKGPVN